MTNEQMRVEIGRKLNYDIASSSVQLPNWPEDLNACHAMEESISDDDWPRYQDILKDLAYKWSKQHKPNDRWFRTASASAPIRCEAFLHFHYLKGLLKK